MIFRIPLISSYNLHLMLQTIYEVIIMADNLDELLQNNSEVSQYFSQLPTSVQNECTSNGGDICSLEDLLRCVKGITGSC